METELEYRLGEHGFFTELVRMVTAISGMALAVEAFSAGVARPHKTRDIDVLEGHASLSDIEMHFYPADVYRAVLRPSTRELRLIRAVKQALNPEPPQHPFTWPSFSCFWRGLWGTRSFPASSGMSMQWSRFGARNDWGSGQRSGSSAGPCAMRWCTAGAFTSPAAPARRSSGAACVRVRGQRPTGVVQGAYGGYLILLMEEMDACLRRLRGIGPQPPSVSRVRLG
jgi:hypothetical protein